jgi:hypothetical protein
VVPTTLFTVLDSSGSGGEASTSGERLVEIYLVDPATGEAIGEPQFTLPGKSLDQLNQIFKNLPDDRYRIVLKLEDGSRRRVLEVQVRDKQPFDPSGAQEEFLIPNDDEQMAPEQSGAPREDVAPPLPGDPLPLEPAKTSADEGEELAPRRAAGPPLLLVAPAVLATAIAQRRQRGQAAIQKALAALGRRPWLRSRLH